MNETARPHFDPHGNGVRIGEADVPAPSAGTGGADAPAPPAAADIVDGLLGTAPSRATQHAPSLLLAHTAVRPLGFRLLAPIRL